jgi:peptidoglycan hydrolase CwlO-like protein
VSVLTKTFVLLVVILSIIMTAGMVVYVNRSQNFVTSDKTQKASIARLTAEKAALTTQIGLIGDERTQVQQAMQRQLDDARKTNDQLQSQLADRDTQIAQLNANLAQVTAAQKSANDALTVAQKTVDTQSGTIADARKNVDDLTKKNAELSFAINDMTNKYEVVNRQERDDREQIAQLQSDNKRQQETLHKNGITDANSRTLNGEPLVNVSGTVRSVQNIGGVPYATISIGAADQVTKGMQLKVIDPKQQNPFLGYLIVDRVEPNEAFGHLTGPRVNDVRANEAEVRSQL